MFDLPAQKMFMDSVHGYVSIPKCFVENIIDTEMFQRLRNVDQTGMRILYPSAKHDRFSHSLGVYHLGSKVVDTVLYNFSQDPYWKISSDGKAITFWAKNKVLFLLACILHDIGHTPFSHALEDLVLDNSYDKYTGKSLPKRLVDTINNYENFDDENKVEYESIDAKSHEQIGALYILEKMESNFIRIYDELIENNYPTINTNEFLFAEHYNHNTTINKDNIKRDMVFVVRMILGLKYTQYEPEYQIQNCFIDLLNGKNFDVDKLDYVIRDTKMSGISNINIDTDRLLNSVCIVTKTKKYNSQYYNKEFKDLLVLGIANEGSDSLSLSGDINGTIHIRTGSEVTLYKGSKISSFEPSSGLQIKYIGSDALFSVGSTVYQNGELMTRVSNGGIPLNGNNGKPFSCKLYNAKLISDDFSFTIDSNVPGSIELRIQGNCKIDIKGPFLVKSPLRIFDATVSGNIHEIEVLGDLIKDTIPSTKCFNEFSIGYKKQAINVISNVLKAADYLYLWIYAHHKVIYYANFLIPIIAANIFKSSELARSPNWLLDYDHIELIDDAFIWTVVKDLCRQDPFPFDDRLKGLCKDLLSRKYRVSLYKSLAEFDLLFEKIPSDRIKEVKAHIIAKRASTLANDKCGFLDDKYVDIIRQKANGELDNINDIVYADADYTTKEINVDEVLIVTNDIISSLSEIPLLSNTANKSKRKLSHFYIFYSSSSLSAEEKTKESKAFKEVIKQIASDAIKS